MFKKEGLPKLIAVALAITLVINVIMSFISQSAFQEIDYSRFLAMLENKEIESVQITEDRILIVPKSQKDAPIGERKMFYTGKLDYPELYDKLYSAGVDFKTPVQNKQSPLMNFLISWVLPFGIFYLFSSMLMGSLSKKMGGGTMSIGKSNAKVYVEKSTGVTFNDVAGQEEAKESLKEIVDLLHSPGKYTKIGA